MYMNLEKLYESQREFENQHQDKVSLQGKALSTKKLLALQVKMGELADETQCFKFWNPKKTPVRRRILQSYIETLYLILSIGIEKGFTETEISPKKADSELTDQFLNLFIDINDFMVCFSEDHYITLVEDFLNLSLTLGFAEEDILEACSEICTA